MIEHVRNLTCDVCGRSAVICVNNLENYYYDHLLKEKAPDWVSVDFKRIRDDDRKYSHLCPECAEKFLVLFEKKEDDRRYTRCTHFIKRYRNTPYGICTKPGGAVRCEKCCDDFVECEV